MSRLRALSLLLLAGACSCSPPTPRGPLVALPPCPMFSDPTALALVSATCFPWCPAWTDVGGAPVEAEGALGGWHYRVEYSLTEGLPPYDSTLVVCNSRGFEAIEEVPGLGLGVDTSCLGHDLDHDGAPDLVLTGYGGGSKCCLNVLVYSLPASGPRLAGSAEVANTATECEDLDGDGRVELWWPNAEFDGFGFPGVRPGVAIPVVVGFAKGGGLVDSTRHYKAFLRRLLKDVESSRPPAEPDYGYPLWTVWESALRVLLGEGRRAWRPLERDGFDRKGRAFWRDQIRHALSFSITNDW